MKMAYANEGIKAAGAIEGAKRETINGVVTYFDRDIERLAKLLTVIEHVGDHLEGGRKEADATATLDTPAHSLLDNIQRKQRAISNLIGRCEDAAVRINNALGI
jgi:hypothetical protein